MTIAQEQDNTRIENLEQENKKLQQQLQTQSALLQKLQKKLLELEKTVRSLKQKEQPLSAKEKKKWLKKISEQQKKLDKLEAELEKINNSQEQLFVLHNVFASFCEQAKKFDAKNTVIQFLQQKKIEYTLQEQQQQEQQDVYAQSFNYEFTVDDINIICELIAEVEKQYVAIQKIDLKGVEENIKVELCFCVVDVAYIEKELSKAKKLIANVKATKEMKKNIEENTLQVREVSLQKTKNIFNKKRNLPTSVSTESRIIPLKKTAKKPPKKAKKTTKKATAKVSVSTAKDAQKKWQEITDKTKEIQKALKNAKQADEIKKIALRIKQQITSRQINVAHNLNQFFSLAEDNPLVIDSLVIDYQKEQHKKTQYKYAWKISCFYFATSLEPTVAFIEKLVVHGFFNQTPLQFKKETLLSRKGYRFLLNLEHSSKFPTGKG